MRDQDHIEFGAPEKPAAFDLGDTYASLARPLHSYALRLGVSASDADDLVAESFARLIAMAEKGKLPNTNLRGYMMRMIRNLAVDTWRAQSRTRPSDDDAVLDRVEQQDDPVVAALDRSAARTALLELPPRVQRAVWLSDVEGRTATDIASSLGVSAVNARALVSRGRRQLRCFYLEALFPQHHSDPDLKSLHGSLAAAAIGSAGLRQSRSALAHIEECAECAKIYQEMQTEASKMRSRSCTLILLSALMFWEWEAFGEADPASIPEAAGRLRRHRRSLWILALTGVLLIAGFSWVPGHIREPDVVATTRYIPHANVTLSLPQQRVVAGSTELTVAMENATDTDQAVVLVLDPKTFGTQGDSITISVASGSGEVLLSATQAGEVLGSPPVLTTLHPGERISLVATVTAR